MKRQYKSGFTLVEIVLVFVLVGILIAITTPLVVETVQRADLTSAHESLYNALTRAQKLSQSQTNGQVWGVCLDNTNHRYIIVAGTCSSNDRNIIYDEIITIAPTISIVGNGGNNIDFSPVSGYSDPNGITLTNGRFSKLINVDGQLIDKDPISLVPPPAL